MARGCVGWLLVTGWLVGVCGGDVVVERPNGGEGVVAGGPWEIAWRCDGGTEAARIEFSYTGGVFWEVIASAAPCKGGRGRYGWTAPELSSPSCLIRVTALNKGGGSDQSDGTFTVFGCTLRMDYDHDCAITFVDLALFAQEWLACGDPYDPACGGNHGPEIVSVPAAEALGDTYVYDVEAVDADGDALIYRLLRGPAGMTIEAGSGRLVWTRGSEQSGSAAVIIQVRDPSGAADIQAFELGGSQSAAKLTGAPMGGYPNLYERRLLVYANAVRMAPQEYRDEYMTGFAPDPSGILESQGPVEPLYYGYELSRSARYHAEDMATNGCFQHDSCDGTAWYERIRAFYPQARSLGENVAFGYPSAKAVIDAWLCDETGGRCAGDNTSAAGHRTNIVSGTYQQMGAGFAGEGSGSWSRYWVQDFASNPPAERPVPVAGCHDFLVAGRTSFLLNYRDAAGQRPESVQVVVDGTAYEMALDLGAPAAGTYRLDLARGGTCREYHFEAVTAAGERWRYPGPGVFVTSGEGSCGEEYR